MNSIDLIMKKKKRWLSFSGFSFIGEEKRKRKENMINI